MSDEPEDALAEIGLERPSPAASTSAAAWEPDDSMVLPKPGLPRWLKFGCGCGCLSAFLFVAFLLVMSWTTSRHAADPEVQWSQLEALLPFDERPTELEVEFGLRVPALFHAGSEQIRLVDRQGRYLVEVRDVRTATAVSALMDPSADTPGERLEGLERGTFLLQGRSVPILRFEESRIELPFFDLPEEEQALGPGVRLDLTETGRFLVVELRRGGPGEAITASELEDFFASFDVWRGR